MFASPDGAIWAAARTPGRFASFDVFLPRRFGDGGIHRLAAVTSSGENLQGSPVTFLAFADGLSDLVASQDALGLEGVRAELFDQLVPSSVPFSRYHEWRRRFPIGNVPAATESCAVVMVGAGAIEDTLTSLEKQSGANWVAIASAAEPDAHGFRTRSGAKLPRRRGRRMRLRTIRPRRNGTGVGRFAADCAGLFGLRRSLRGVR